jgi:hypothetical protein
VNPLNVLIRYYFLVGFLAFIVLIMLFLFVRRRRNIF